MNRPVMPLYYNSPDIGINPPNPLVKGAKEQINQLLYSSKYARFRNMFVILILITVFIICIINVVNYANVQKDYDDNEDNLLYNIAKRLSYNANTTLDTGPPGPGNISWNNPTYQYQSTELYVSTTTNDTPVIPSSDVANYLTSLQEGDVFFVDSATGGSSNYQVWNVKSRPILNTNDGYVTISAYIGTSQGAGFIGYSNGTPLTLIIPKKDLLGTSQRVSTGMLIFGIVINSIIGLISLVYVIYLFVNMSKPSGADDKSARKLVNQVVTGAKIKAEQAAEDVITKTEIDPDDVAGSKAYLLSTLKFQIENNLDKYVASVIEDI